MQPFSLTSHQALGCACLSSCQSLRTGWLMNSGKGPSWTDPAQPHAADPTGTSAPKPLCAGTASLYIYQKTPQSPFQYSLTFVRKRGKKLELITGPLINTELYFSDVQPHLACWKSCHLYWRGVSWSWTQQAQVSLKKQTLKWWLPPAWPRVMVFKQMQGEKKASVGVIKSRASTKARQCQND